MKPARPDFFISGGTLRPDAPSYVERQADRDLFDGLLRGEFCYVLTSRQMGKSSLMVRTAARLRDQGLQVVVLDLTAVGQNLTPEQWYDGLLTRLAGQLDLEAELDAFWAAEARLSPVQRFFQALRDIVLPRQTGALVIFVDEIDVVRSLKFSTDEFFAAVRECYNRRTESPLFDRVTFCLLGVAAPSDLIQDTRTTPFNIGRRIELHDFTAGEARPLARGLARVGAGETAAQAALERILYWTNGHPYLTQRLCQALASRPATVPGHAAVDGVCDELFLSTRAREQDDNLLFVRKRLLRSEVDLASLLSLYARILRGRPRVADEPGNTLADSLHLAGIVRTERGRLVVRNRIYRRVFDDRWIQSSMPDAELRRQRAAFYRGVVRTTAIAAVVVLALSAAVWLAVRNAAEARQALAQSDFSQAQTRRGSGGTGQRHESLAALARARPHLGDPAALRDEAIACLALLDLRPALVLSNFPPETTAVALAPDLEHCAVGDVHGAVQVFQTADGRAVGRVPPNGLPVAWLALSGQGRFIAAAHAAGPGPRFVIWDTHTNQPVLISTNEVQRNAVDFSADDSLVALTRQPGVVELFSLPTGQPRGTLALDGPAAADSPRQPSSLRLNRDGDRLAEAAPGSQRVQVWTIGPTNRSTRLSHRSEITALAWSPDGRHLAAAGSADLSIWDMEFVRRRDIAQAQVELVQDLAFSPDGTLLASTDANGTLSVWCQASGRRLDVSLPAEPSGRVFFDRAGRRLGIAGLRTGVRIWEVAGGREYRVLRAAAEVHAPITSLAFDPGSRVLFGGSDLGAFAWDTATGRTLHSPRRLYFVRTIAVHPSSGDLYVSYPDGLLRWPRRVLPESGGTEIHFGPPQVFDLPSGLEKCSLAAEVNQAVVAHGNHAHRFRLNDPTTATQLPMRGGFQELSLSPDGKWLAAWSEIENEIQVWSMNAPASNAPSPRRLPGGRHFAFTPDGAFLLTGHDRKQVLWNTMDWSPADISRTLGASRETPLAFGRTGENTPRTLLAISEQPGVVRLFELNPLETPASLPRIRPLARLTGPDRRRLQVLTFSPQCRRLAATTTDQTVQVWDLASLRLGLAGFGLDRDLPEFPAQEPEQDVSLRVAPATSTAGIAELWLQIEAQSLALDAPGATEPKQRAARLVERGKAYLSLKRHDLARSDFEAALRLKPGDEAISRLLERARTLPQAESASP